MENGEWKIGILMRGRDFGGWRQEDIRIHVSGRDVGRWGEEKHNSGE